MSGGLDAKVPPRDGKQRAGSRWQLEMDRDCFGRICEYVLSPADLLALGQVCSTWRHHAKRDMIWARMCDRANWPQLGKDWFLQKYRDFRRFSQQPRTTVLRLASGPVSLFAPEPVRTFDWESGRARNVNEGLLITADMGARAVGGTESEVSEGGVRAWNAMTGASVRSIPSRGGGSGGRRPTERWTTGAIYSTGFVYADTLARIVQRDFMTQKEYKLGSHESTVTSLEVSPKGGLAVSGSYDKTLRVWDLKAHRCRAVIQLEMRTWAVAVHPYGSLAAAGNDGSVAIWRVSDQKQVGQVFPASKKTILSLAFDPEAPDQRIFEGGYDPTITLWEFRTRRRVRVFRGAHRDIVHTCLALPSILVTASRDRTVVVWDRHTGAVLNTLRGHSLDVKCLARVDTRRIASGGYDNTVRVWEFPQVKLSQPRAPNAEPGSAAGSAGPGAASAGDDEGCVVQ